MKHSFLSKTVSFIATFALLFNTLATPYSVLAQEVTPEPTPEATVGPTATPTDTPTPIDTSTPTPTDTATPIETVLPTDSPTIEPTVTPVDTILPSDNPTSTPSPVVVETGNLTTTIIENVDFSGVIGLNTNVDTGVLTTDQADYSPTSVAMITGTGFSTNKTYTLVISSNDEPPVTSTSEVTTDSNGNFTYSYQLDGNYRPNYKVEIKSGEVVVATTSFTDSATVNTATVNGGSSVSVGPGDSITAALNATSGSANADKWKGTGWRIATTPGAETCYDNNDHTSSTNTESFSITAPTSVGTYNTYFQTFSNNSCTTDPSSTTTLTNGVVVQARDLTAVKSNSLGGGNATSGVPFTWTIRVTNSGPASAVFADKDELLLDEMPNTGVNDYGTPVLTTSGITGTINCTQSGGSKENLSCKANGTVTMPAASYFDVTVTVNPTSTGSLVNPRSGKTCAVDTGNKITESNEGNNTCSNSVTVSTAVVKTNPTLSISNSPVTFNGSTQSATVNGSVAGTVSNIRYNGSATVPTNATTYAVTADFAPTDTTNYNSLTGASAGNFVINKASSTTTVTCPASVSYTGSALTPCSATVTGAGGLSLTPTPIYNNNIDAGTATATYTYAGDANHNGSSNTKNFTINKADQTITFGVLGSKTYGDSDFTVSANSSSGLTVTFSTQTPSVCSVSGTTVHILTQGTCTVRASQGGDTNYNTAPNVDQGFTVAKKSASVTPDANSKTYGDSDPIFTGTLTGFLSSDSVTAVYSRTTGQDVATYTISAVLSPSEVLGNYTITYNTADFTITARDITVTADSLSKNFGESDPIFTYTITDGGLAYSDEFNGELTRDAGESVGTYPITQGTLALSDNYNLTFVPGTFTIIDNIPPTGTWTTPTDGSTISGNVFLQFDATDAESGVASVNYWYSSDGIDFTAIGSDIWDTTTLPLGDYKLRAVVTDNAGNTTYFDESVGISAVISNENGLGNTGTTAQISWTTDRPTKTRVVYDTVSHGSLGAEPNYGYAFSTDTFDASPEVYSHFVTITSLNTGTTYYYRMISAGSPTAISNEHSFNTLSVAGAPGPSGNSGNTQVLGASTSIRQGNWPVLAYVNSGTTGEDKVLGTSTDNGASQSADLTVTQDKFNLIKWIMGHKKISIGLLLLILALVYILKRQFDKSKKS